MLPNNFLLKNHDNYLANASVFCRADGYKWDHHRQYPESVTFVYSNLTPRKDRSGLGYFVFFGLQAALLQIDAAFQKFFDNDIEEEIQLFRRDFVCYGGEVDEEFEQKIRELHRYARLPLEFRAIPEGTVVQHNTPVLTLHNTQPWAFWLTNFIETWLSAELWHISTSATTALGYRVVFERYANDTSDSEFLIKYQGHNFSPRGLPSIRISGSCGAGHATSFFGDDALLTMPFVRTYYPFEGMWEAFSIIRSVWASEHSVSCAGGKENEKDTLIRLITEVHPTGIFSFVSDTWDFWKLVTETLVEIKDVILARDGKLVIRPDSSPKTPVEIICGDPDADPESPEGKGLIQCLWDIFGGTVNSKGYRELDSHIGAIYGDSITPLYQRQILSRLKAAGFASTNIVLGIGSYTYQYVTRDTHGTAMKATAVGSGWDAATHLPKEITAIYKDPATDKSGKKSARGLLAVREPNPVSSLGTPQTVQDVSVEDFLHLATDDLLQPVYREGWWLRTVGFDEVRARIDEAAAQMAANLVLAA